MSIKVVIVAGGMGTRLAEETEIKPKPMVEIGGRPILWHIMMHYSTYGYKEFVIALGYKGEYIKRWFKDYCALNSNLTVKTATGEVMLSGGNVPDWTVELVDTGKDTFTGGRMKRLSPWIGNNTFMLANGDGVSDINLEELLKFHRSHGKLVTMTAVRPPARFGHMVLGKGGRVSEFSEKPQTAEGWINGAFSVCEPEALEYIGDDEPPWERAPLENLAKDGQLMAYCHTSFWQCMDTLRDKVLLENLWQSGTPPWKTW